MKVFIITPFPDVIHSFMKNSMIKKAQEYKLVDYKVLNLFDYADEPHRNIDDYPFGGGTGMIMKPEPIFRAFDEIKREFKPNLKNVIYPTPDGKVFDQNEANKFKESETLVFICGHYKGIDHRVRDNLVTHEYSIGDYIITGGELSSLVILDSIIRLIPGVLNNIESAKTDSFESGLLDCNYYTRPEIFRDLKVPEVLLSGHHQKIDDWKLEQKKNKTKKNRPDLWLKHKNDLE
jgi:tRNA (guanine37-N1)-methyltransferase